MTRNRWINGSFGVGMLAFFAASCENAEDAITPDEARAIAHVIMSPSFSVFLDQVGGAVPPNDLAEYDITRRCFSGGTAHLKGTMEKDVEAGYFWTEVISTFDNCAREWDYVGTVTLITEGSIDGMLRWVRVDGRFDGSWSGNVSWESDDGGSGKCEVDFAKELTWRIDPGTGSVGEVTGHTKGTICGVSLD